MPRNSGDLIARANPYRSPRNLVAHLAPGGLVALFEPMVWHRRDCK